MAVLMIGPLFIMEKEFYLLSITHTIYFGLIQRKKLNFPIGLLDVKVGT